MDLLRFSTFEMFFVVAFDVTSDDSSEDGGKRKHGIDGLSLEIFYRCYVVCKHCCNIGYL